jgi:hypothetical protein
MSIEAITTFVAHTRWGQNIALTSSPVLTAPAVLLPNFGEVDLEADVEVVVNNVEDLTVAMEVSATGKTGPWLINNLDGSNAGATDGGTDLTVSRTNVAVTVLSSTGEDAILPAANGSNAGVMTAAQFSKLEGIEAGAEVNPTGSEIVTAIDTALGNTDWQQSGGSGATNLGASYSATEVTVTSDTGTDVALVAADADSAGIMTSTMFSKLNGIEAGAEVNHTLSEALAAYSVGFGLAGNWIDQPTLSVTSNGTTISATVGAATFITSDGVGSYAGSTISLQAGTSAVPVLNYIYVLESDLTLYYSTSGFPAELHVPVAIVLCQSAVNVQADGVYNIIRFENHSTAVNEMGAAAEFYLAAQQDEPIWISGLIVSHTITTNGGSDDDIDLDFTSGVVRRGKRVAINARDTSATDSVYIANSSVAAYTKVNNLGTALKTSAGGGAIADGDYAVLVVWAAVSDTETASKMFVNLPTAFYKTEADARADAKALAVYAPPAALKNSAVLLSRRVFRYTAAGGGTWTHIVSTDLRGAKPSYFVGRAADSKESLASDFRIVDSTDVTKKVAFATAGASGQTRTVTVPDASGTLSYLDVAQAFAAGAKKTFSHSATVAGIRVAPVAGDPSAPEDGDIWYNSTTNKFRKRQNGVTEDMDIASSSAAGGSDLEIQYNNGGAFSGTPGLLYNETDNRPVMPNGWELGEPGTLETDAPTANSVVVETDQLRGERRLRVVNDRGNVHHVQPHLMDRHAGQIFAIGNFATLQSPGLAFTASGTAAQVTQATTNLKTSVARVRFDSNSVASDSGVTNGTAGIRYSFRDAYRGNGTIIGGFYFSSTWSLATLTTNCRGMPCNVSNTVTGLVGNVTMASILNTLAIGWESGQTTYRVFAAGGTAASPVDLGASFPVNTSDLYRGHIWCYPNDTEVYYRLENLTTGASTTGTFANTNLPSTTTILGWNILMNNGGDAAVCAIEIARAYWERSITDAI